MRISRCLLLCTWSDCKSSTSCLSSYSGNFRERCERVPPLNDANDVYACDHGVALCRPAKCTRSTNLPSSQSSQIPGSPSSTAMKLLIPNLSMPKARCCGVIMKRICEVRGRLTALQTDLTLRFVSSVNFIVRLQVLLVVSLCRAMLCLLCRQHKHP